MITLPDLMHALPNVDDYYWTMAARGRLLKAYEEGFPGVFCTFFVLPDLADIARFYPRGYWTIPEDLPDGPVIFVDKLVGQHMNAGVFRALERMITQRVPSWRVATWFRPSPSNDPDRRYSYNRRIHGNNL